MLFYVQGVSAVSMNASYIQKILMIEYVMNSYMFYILEQKVLEDRCGK